MYTIKLCIQIETCDRTETEACSRPHKLDFCIQSKGTQKANGYGYIPPITTFCFDERYHRDWNFHLVLYLSTYAVHWQATKSFFQPLDARQWQCNHTDTHTQIPYIQESEWPARFRTPWCCCCSSSV